MNELADKFAKLKDCLSSLKSVLIAFSGGVDSTFLLYAAREALSERHILAVIAQSPTYPAAEVTGAQELCDKFGIKYQLIKTDEFADENFIANPKERCYFCKKGLFTKLNQLAKQSNIAQVMDGSNHDDKSDYRPGSRAKEELGIKSPLMELGFTKQDIRDLSKEFKLPTWDKPSSACLASRIPYGTRISAEILRRVEEGEGFLRGLGFKQLRVRHHGAIVRLELERAAIAEVLRDGLMSKISRKFEELGYTYVALDLKGYRSGSMNENLE